MQARVFVKADRLQRQIADLANDLGRGAVEPVIRNALLRGGDHYLAYTRRRFKASQAAGWPPLSESRKRQKIRKGTYSKGTLIDTGRLFASLTPGAPGNIRVVLPDGVRVGSSDPNARRHHKGLGRNPRRVIFWPADAQAKALAEAELAKAVDKLLSIIFSRNTAA